MVVTYEFERKKSVTDTTPTGNKWNLETFDKNWQEW